jgi:hypothetical protein
MKANAEVVALLQLATNTSMPHATTTHHGKRVHYYCCVQELLVLPIPCLCHFGQSLNRPLLKGSKPNDNPPYQGYCDAYLQYEWCISCV